MIYGNLKSHIILIYKKLWEDVLLGRIVWWQYSSGSSEHEYLHHPVDNIDKSMDDRLADSRDAKQMKT